jgi:hypothetical protein
MSHTYINICPFAIAIVAQLHPLVDEPVFLQLNSSTPLIILMQALILCLYAHCRQSHFDASLFVVSFFIVYNTSAPLQYCNDRNHA